jgi:hypothetical protein
MAQSEQVEGNTWDWKAISKAEELEKLVDEKNVIY